MDCINHVQMGDEGSGPSCYQVSRPIARKAHTCCECRTIILPGKQYTVESGLWDGDFQTFKTCPDCMSVRNSFFNAGFQYESLWEDLEEHINYCRGEIGEIHIACLTPRARNIVCDMIEEAQEGV